MVFIHRHPCYDRGSTFLIFGFLTDGTSWPKTVGNTVQHFLFHDSRCVPRPRMSFFIREQFYFSLKRFLVEPCKLPNRGVVVFEIKLCTPPLSQHASIAGPCVCSSGRTFALLGDQSFVASLHLVKGL